MRMAGSNEKSTESEVILKALNNLRPRFNVRHGAATVNDHGSYDGKLLFSIFYQSTYI